jgi:hypothetical protein
VSVGTESRINKQRQPDREQSKVTLAEMAQEVLMCRTDRHIWRHVKDDTVLHRTRLVEFTRRHECERCDAWKEVTRSVPSFDIVKKSGNYAPGYLSSEGRLHSSEVFTEQLTRLGYKIGG